MIIAPKLATVDTRPSWWMGEVYEGAVEIQLMTYDLVHEAKQVERLLTMLPETKTLLVHLPFGAHNLSLYLASSGWRERLATLMRTLNSERSYVVMHVEMSWKTLQLIDYLDALSSIYKAGGEHTEFMFENALVNPSHGVEQVDVEPFLRATQGIPYIHGLVDMTHLNASRNCTWHYPVYSQEAMYKVQAYHIASALNGDGWSDKATHGRCHRSYHMLAADMDVMLSSYPMHKDTIAVVEVSENNYQDRHDQYIEYIWLRRYREKVLR